MVSLFMELIASCGKTHTIWDEASFKLRMTGKWRLLVKANHLVDLGFLRLHQ